METTLVWRGPWLGIEPGNLPHSKPALYNLAIEEAVYSIGVIYFLPRVDQPGKLVHQIQSSAGTSWTR